MPDAELYIRSYLACLDGGAATAFPFPQDQERDGFVSPLLAVNRIFYQDRESPFGHCTMFDRHLLGAVLTQIGFIDIKSQSFRTGRDAFLLLDTEERWVESFAIEASKPS